MTVFHRQGALTFITCLFVAAWLLGLDADAALAQGVPPPPP